MSLISPCVLIFRSANLVAIWEHGTLFSTFPLFLFLPQYNICPTGACFSFPRKLLIDPIKKPEPSLPSNPLQAMGIFTGSFS